jgi:anti-anti-sigma regulatory factor
VGPDDLVLGDPIAPGDVPGLCERARVLLAGTGADVLVCDVRALTRPDAVAVHALARLALTVRRQGARLWLRHVPDELGELLDLVGLSGVLAPAPHPTGACSGSPKRGNSASVSRKNVNSAILPPETSST